MLNIVMRRVAFCAKQHYVEFLYDEGRLVIIYLNIIMINVILQSVEVLQVFQESSMSNSIDISVCMNTQ